MKIDPSVANTIYQQLGGRQFILMTGAKDFKFTNDSLSFKIGRNKTRCNFITITYNPGLDDYTMTFAYIANNSLTVLDTIDNLFFVDLQPEITRFTGLYTAGTYAQHTAIIFTV